MCIVVCHDVQVRPSVPVFTLFSLSQLLKFNAQALSRDTEETRDSTVPLNVHADCAVNTVSYSVVSVFLPQLRWPKRDCDFSPSCSTEVRMIDGTIRLLLYALVTCTITTSLIHHSSNDFCKFSVLFDKLGRYIQKVLIELRQN